MTPSITIPNTAVTITVDKTGAVSVTDQQGNISQVGQIQLARFVNTAGLTSIGRNLFDKTEASGEPTVGNPNADGRGAITQFFLEMSNVNVIDEMVKMIAGQRNYEINSKAVQTADAMLGIVNNLKR